MINKTSDQDPTFDPITFITASFRIARTPTSPRKSKRRAICAASAVSFDDPLLG
jgi:hypothetical protein